MITLHDSAATRFDATGLGVLDNHIISPVVVEELNAAFGLSFDYPAWGEYAEQLMVGQIVACPVPWSDQKQAFRITAIDTSIDQVLHVEANHVFVDLAHNLIADTFMVNKTPAAALSQLLGAANYPHPFTAVSSDTGTVATARIVRTSIAAAMLDDDKDNSFLARWGGEFTFDNWQIKHAPRRGSLTSIVIQDRKNLTGYTSSIDTASLATRILPVGYDGLLLPELYVDSSRIADYAYPFVKVVKYNQVKAIKDPNKPKYDEVPLEQAHAMLRKLAQAEYAAGVDLPTATYDVSFVDLSTTREYADLAKLEHVNLGDTVIIKHTDLGVNLTARVISYTFNPLTGSYLSIQLGNAAPAFTSVAATARAMSTAVAEANEVAAIALASADGKNTNYYSSTAPVAPHLGDTWFKDEGEAGTSIWTYTITDNGEPGWIPLISPINEAVFFQALEQATSEAHEAKQAAEGAKQIAQAVNTKVDDLENEVAIARGCADAAAKDTSVLWNNFEAYRTTVTNEQHQMQSHITQLSNAVNLRVTKDGIIAQINISPETILIDGTRVHITGQTSIDNAIITTAMIKDAAITDAKIGSLSAGKITTGTLAAARIAAGSITSDKLTIANGFIKTAMIADAAITNVKVANVDAAKITTGYLAAARIKAGTITADKFASNAIQVGLAGWTNSIRITPYQIAWYSGSTLQGKINSNGMEFYYGDRYIGRMGETYKDGNTAIRGITMQLNGQGDFVTWSYRTSTTGTYTSFFTLDPKGSYYGAKGIHLGTDLRTHGWTFYTNGNRGINPQDATLTNIGTFPAWASTNNYSKVVFGNSDLYVVTKNTFYNMTSVMSRIKDLMGRVNTLINLLNHGWITSISGSGSNISWQYYSNTGYQAMSTTLT